MDKQIPQRETVDLHSMEPAARRILIAEDALALLKSKFIFGETDFYVGRRVPDSVKPTDQMQDVVAQWLTMPNAGYGGAGGVCGVCVLGAALLSAVRCFDELTAEDFVAHGTVRRVALVNYLTTFFSDEQLDLMEVAFEGRHIIGAYSLSQEQYNKALDFSMKYQEETERLHAIFTNIIEHNGDFVP